jgi:hypothetical protein
VAYEIVYRLRDALLETVPAEVLLMTAEEQERIRQLCILIQTEKEHTKLTALMQELFEVLESNERRRDDDQKKATPNLANRA